MSDKIKDIEKRKEELREEIRSLQNELDRSVGEAQTDLKTKLKPRNLIREYPLSSLGVTIIAGLILGNVGRTDNSSKNYTEEKTVNHSNRTGKGIGSHLWSELKRSLTKRAARLLLNYLDEMIAARGAESEKSEK